MSQSCVYIARINTGEPHEHPCVDELTRNDFARKFRVPYEAFYELYEEMKHDDFMRERSMAVPLKIKLLASLRYLAL